jgi:hypothetical protein
VAALNAVAGKAGAKTNVSTYLRVKMAKHATVVLFVAQSVLLVLVCIELILQNTQMMAVVSAVYYAADWSLVVVLLVFYREPVRIRVRNSSVSHKGSSQTGLKTLPKNPPFSNRLELRTGRINRDSSRMNTGQGTTLPGLTQLDSQRTKPLDKLEARLSLPPPPPGQPSQNRTFSSVVPPPPTGQSDSAYRSYS